MITDPKVGDKYWIIFVQDDGSRNRAHLVIAKATILHIEDADSGCDLGPLCVCAVIPETNRIFFSPQRVHTYHMYNTWDEAMRALEGVLTWGIFKLRQYKEKFAAEARKKLSAIASDQDIKNTVEEFLADQCTMIDIQEPFEQPKEDENTGKAPEGYQGALPPMPE